MTTVGRATIIIVLGTIISNLIGVVKSMVVAKYFGVGPGLDAFYISIIPPMVVTWLLVGAMQSSLIPVLINFNTKHRAEESITIFHSFFTLSIILFFLLTTFTVASADFIISVIAPGFRDERARLASNLLRIVAPIILFGGVSDLISGVLNAHKKFAIPAFGSGINILASLGYLMAFRSQGIHALAIGTLFGSMVQCVYSMTSAYFSGFRLKLVFHFLDPETKRILQLTAPMFLGLTFSHANIIVDQIMASVLPSGSIAALNYANSINDVASQLFILSIGSAILPFFSQAVAEKRIDDLKETFYIAVRMAAYILIPIVTFVMILGTPAVSVVFERGAFDRNSTLAVSHAWKAFSAGLFTFAVNVIIARALTASERTSSLASVAFLSIFFNIALNYILMKPLSHVGIALSTSITSFLSSFPLLYLFSKYVGKIEYKKIYLPLLKIAAGSLISGLLVLLLAQTIDVFRIRGLLAISTVGGVGYLLFSWFGRLPELKILLGDKFSKYAGFEA